VAIELNISKCHYETMAREDGEKMNDEVVIQFTRGELQEKAKQTLGRFLTKEEEEVAIDLAPAALYDLVSLTIQMNEVEPGGD